ncbi:MAG: hypothetical protein MZU97_15795 [Bacillus subtilis]|nr:hypothetical protein [Bacillus subtilis]
MEIYLRTNRAPRRRTTSAVGETVDKVKDFYYEIAEMNLVPAGRVLFGAGSQSAVTYFNCFVMPYVHDSRVGISEHRQKVMEIMIQRRRRRHERLDACGRRTRSPKASAANPRAPSAGCRTLSQLTNLVEQGGSRRGAQMIMMARLASRHHRVHHLEDAEHPRILQFLIENIKDEDIVREAKSETQVHSPSRTRKSKWYEVLRDSRSESTRHAASRRPRYKVHEMLLHERSLRSQEPRLLQRREHLRRR